MIELMIALVIIGILASIAYPSYVNRTREARRADAQGALVELSQYMERFYTLNNRYDQDLLGNPVSLPAMGVDEYNFSLDSVTANTFTLAAAPVIGGIQAGDKCGTLRLTNTGITTPAACW